jgi:hypothetical protein
MGEPIRSTAIDDTALRYFSNVIRDVNLNQGVTSDVEDILPIRQGEIAQVSKFSTRRTALATFDRRRGGSVFRIIDNDSDRIAYGAYDLKVRSQGYIRGHSVIGGAALQAGSPSIYSTTFLYIH